MGAQNLNPLLAQDRPAWRRLRARVSELLRHDADQRTLRAVPREQCRRDAASAVRARRLRRLLQLAGARVRRRAHVPSRRSTPPPELALDPDRVPRPRRHGRRDRHRHPAACRPATACRRRATDRRAHARRSTSSSSSASSSERRRGSASRSRSSAPRSICSGWSSSTTGARATSRRGNTGRSARSSARASRRASAHGSCRGMPSLRTACAPVPRTRRPFVTSHSRAPGHSTSICGSTSRRPAPSRSR